MAATAAALSDTETMPSMKTFREWRHSRYETVTGLYCRMRSIARTCMSLRYMSDKRANTKCQPNRIFNSELQNLVFSVIQTY